MGIYNEDTKHGVSGATISNLYVTADVQLDRTATSLRPPMRTISVSLRAAVVLTSIVMGAQPALAQFPIDRVIPTRPGQSISMDIDAGGAVSVVGTDANEVRVRVDEGRQECEPRCRVDIDQDGDGVRVRAYHVNRSSRTRGGLRFTVQVPKRYDVKIETTGGTVEVDGVTGRISGRTMGGALRFSNLSGSLNFSTMGGGITVRDSDLDGRVHTMGGSVTIDGVRGNLSGTTMGGRVTRNGSANGVTLSSTSGRRGQVEVKSSGVLSMRSMGGDIELDDAPNGADLQTMGGFIKLRHAGGNVRAHTMGGRITLGEVDGSIKATTMGGDVTARMIGDPSRGDRDVEISSMGGDIDVTVPAGLSMDIDVEIAYTRKHEGDYRVISDVPLKQSVSENWSRAEGDARKKITATGSVGGGKNRVRIRTINGNVRINRL